MLEITIRLVFSLAVVLGLLALLAKFGARRFRGGKDAMVQVLHRQSISRGTAVTVVNVAGRVLVLGTTEQQVRVLTELDPEDVAEPSYGASLDRHIDDDIDDEDGLPGEVLTLVPPASGTDESADRPSWVPTPAAATGALAGSVLSVDTWRQALAAATRRTP
jgi:flagellar protein FliO/FliZ